VELALIAPVLIVLLLGVVELGAALRARIAIINAAREGARLAGRGGVFSDAEVLQVVEGQSRSVDLAGSGSLILTTARCAGSCTWSSSTLSGSATSRLDTSSINALHAQLIASEPDYLGEESFVVLEIFYDHSSWTGLWGGTLSMYASATMPVSAPS